MQTGHLSAALRARLGEQGTMGLLDALDTSRQEWKGDVVVAATDRFERRLAEECGAMRVEMAHGFTAIREEIAATKVQLIKWSFVFWIGQLAALTGVLSFVLKFVSR